MNQEEVCTPLSEKKTDVDAMSEIKQKGAPLFCSRRLSVDSVQEILQRNEDVTAWDSWGVRDAAILADEDGAFVQTDSSLVMYYTGSTNQGAWQQTGRAVSIDAGESWDRNPEGPVLEANSDAWDEKVASTPWVIKIREKYFLYYRGSRSAMEEDAIGLAMSSDGINFKKHGENPILTASDFLGIRNHPATMGVLNAVCDYDGSVIILFEAHESEYDQRGQIFAARSDDGLDFTPMNSGAPLFSARNVKSWPVLGVCNPRLTKIGSDWFMLGFNGTYNGEYSLGVAFTKDFINWYEHLDNPIMVPRGWPAGESFTHRIEGPCFDLDHIRCGNKRVDCYVMAIPYGGENHENGVNAKVVFNVSDQKTEGIHVRALPVKPRNLDVKDNNILLNAHIEPSGFLQAHHIVMGSINRFSTEVSFDAKATNQSAGYLVLSNTLTSLPRGIGTIIKITPRAVYVRQEKEVNLDNPLIERLPRFAERVMNKVLVLMGTRDKFPHAPNDDWVRVASISNSERGLINLDFKENNQSDCSELIVNGEVVNLPINYKSNDSRILTFAGFKCSIRFRNIRIVE